MLIAVCCFAGDGPGSSKDASSGVHQSATWTCKSIADFKVCWQEAPSNLLLLLLVLLSCMRLARHVLRTAK
jgi:hypothetical protein